MKYVIKITQNRTLTAIIDAYTELEALHIATFELASPDNQLDWNTHTIVEADTNSTVHDEEYD